MMNNLPWITIETSSSGDVLTVQEQMNPQADRKPLFITMVGRKTKAVLLDQMLGTPLSVSDHRQVLLLAAPRLQCGQTPTVVIDCGILSGRACQPDATDKQRATSTSWNMQPSIQKSLSAALCDRVFAPFSTVISYFVSDMGGQKSVINNWLAPQAVSPISSDLPALSRVLLVVETASDTFDESIARIRILTLLSDTMQELKEYSDPKQVQDDINSHFSDITVLGLNTSMTASKRATALKKRILALSRHAMHARTSASVQFSFRHFQALSKQALQHLCAEQCDPFSFANNSRPRGFAIAGFEDCLLDCLSQTPSQAWLWHFVAPLVASALLLASYPPGAHDFTPAFLFSSMFSGACQSAMFKYTIHEDVQKKFAASILAEFKLLFDDYSTSKLSASEIHYRSLQKLQPHLVEFKSHRSCFCCFMRMPEKVLTCGHALCDTCIKIYGRRSQTERNTYTLPECMLCGVSYINSVFRFVPPTAGFRVLCLDGGGIRGVIPLMYLGHLERALASFDCPVREQFDFICGTSAGGLVVIGMFLLQWSALESLQRFEDIAWKTFGGRKEPSTLLAHAFELLVACIQDGQYSLSAIEEAFKEACNSQFQMFNPLRNDTKVSVTTTTANDSVAGLFTNYNGGKRPGNTGYNVYRAQSPQNDVSVSEAACCTSAAPWFFKPQSVHNRRHQDGGLQHNCPASIAQWETRFLWPQQADPDFMLSLGTGTSSSITSSDNQRFYMRLFKSFMRNLDGEEAWKKFFNTLPLTSRSRYHRLNLRIRGAEPRLDDVHKISELKVQTTKAIQTDKVDIAATVDSMIASMFYFELEDLPVLENGEYKCSGYIFCRLDLSQQGRRFLYHRLVETSSWFLIQGRPIICVPATSKSLPPFKRRIKFSVESLDETLAISIKGITTTSKLISGFPKSLTQLIDLQQLSSPFGTTNHLREEKALPASPSKRSPDSFRYTKGLSYCKRPRQI